MYYVNRTAMFAAGIKCNAGPCNLHVCLRVAKAALHNKCSGKSSLNIENDYPNCPDDHDDHGNHNNHKNFSVLRQTFPPSFFIESFN